MSRKQPEPTVAELLRTAKKSMGEAAAKGTFTPLIEGILAVQKAIEILGVKP